MRGSAAFALGRASVHNREHVAFGLSDRGQCDLSEFAGIHTIKAGFVENDAPIASQNNVGVGLGAHVTMYLTIVAKQVFS